ncbi:MAG: hypothetical protein A2W20_08670 [Candidatus Aminicenantes bacterium RBG_16_66_30]|nr:MAG: hypothetical protein A2W20_08670 [Candidatus Aminicenantes bacterium RBG_16_66_30]
MKRQAMFTIAAMALVLGAGIAAAAADFKVPFPLQAGGKKLAAGDYAVAKTAEGALVLKQASTGKDIPLTVLERIPKPAPPVAEARLVFDEVGDFAPSYTEYVTVYILSEVWFPGEDGYRVHVTKGAHKTKVVTGGAAK